jgi:hypothetical protein
MKLTQLQVRYGILARRASASTTVQVLSRRAHSTPRCGFSSEAAVRPLGMGFTTCASAAKEDAKALANWAKKHVARMVRARKKLATERAAEPEPPPLTPKKQEAVKELGAKKKSRELALRPRKAPDKFEPAMMWSTAKHKLVAFAPGKEQSTGNRIIDLDAVHILLRKTDCKVCHRKGCLMIDAKLEAETRRGLASNLPIWCSHCKRVVDHLPTSKAWPGAEGTGWHCASAGEGEALGRWRECQTCDERVRQAHSQGAPGAARGRRWAGRR